MCIRDRFDINTYTTGAQLEPSVAAHGDGFVVTWTDHSGSSGSRGGSDYDIFGKIFTTTDTNNNPVADGTPVEVEHTSIANSNEFLINTASGDQSQSSVTELEDGGFVVTWRDDKGSDHDGGDGIDVFGQRFDASGSPVGDDFLVNAAADSGSQYEPSVVGLGNGKFVVVWRDDSGASHDKNENDATLGASYDVRAQIFNTLDTDGSALTTPQALGGDFRVNDATYHYQYQPSVDSFSDGSFIVTYTSYKGDGHNSYGIMGQRFAADGTPLGNELKINSDYKNYNQYEPSVTTLANDKFVETWRDDGGSSGDVRGQMFNADGSEFNSEFLVNSYTDSTQKNPSVASLTDGGFIVSWESSGQDGDSYGIYAQRYGANGQPASLTSYAGTDGDDTATLTATTASNLLVDLGGGTDSVTFGTGNDTAIVRGAETVNMGDGDDTVTVDGASLANQVSKITLSGEVRDLYTVTVNGYDVSYVTQPGDTLVEVRAGLMGTINTDVRMASMVTASGGNTASELMLTSMVSGANEFQICLLYTSPSPRD